MKTCPDLSLSSELRSTSGPSQARPGYVVSRPGSGVDTCSGPETAGEETTSIVPTKLESQYECAFVLKHVLVGQYIFAPATCGLRRLNSDLIHNVLLYGSGIRNRRRHCRNCALANTAPNACTEQIVVTRVCAHSRTSYLGEPSSYRSRRHCRNTYYNPS